MIKNFEEYIKEDYFSKLASRKDNGDIRKENEITEDFVMSYCDDNYKHYVKSISFRKENGKSIVDIDGVFNLSDETEEIPFQFGKINGDFSCSCTNLKNLKGCPIEVSGDFYCNECKKLISLEGCPKKVGGEFYCHGCSKVFSKMNIKSLCNVKGKIYN